MDEQQKISITPKSDTLVFKFSKHKKPQLSGVVKNIMEIRGNGSPAFHRLFPRNTPEILINLGQALKGKIGNHLLIARNTTIQGSKMRYMDVEHPGNCHFISIRFTTNGLYKLLGIPQYEFTDQLFQLDDVIDQQEQRMPKLHNFSSDHKRFQHLFDGLYRLISQKVRSNDLISDFIIEELSQNPSLSVYELVEKTGFTRKHLAKRFKEETGLTIKKYLRIQRIYRIQKQIKDDHSPDWTKLAYRYGFYDQSHFIRDFKQLTGLTPTEYSNPSI